ncbi:MAG: glycoside hydrolase family 2 [Lachnospiraceae bacterium]|nr:glycoside hydrolase family 2 [Lachnospiraceae bacterium]MCD7956723.1 glycoside hydrolase family 2 [Lachnospiraceae bacterium]
MRLFDALAASRPGKPRQTTHFQLTTKWGRQIDPEHVLQEYPRPQLRRREWICLNGTWSYAITRSGSRPRHVDGGILVPFSPETRLSGVGRRLKPGEYLWYQRSIQIPEIPEGKRLLLHFGAVDQTCTVWWNGHLAGRNENGYLPFTVEVTDFVKQGKNNLRVRVRDDTEESRRSRGKQSLHPGGMYYTAQSGIWQTVWLEWVPENYLKNLKITPDLDRGHVCLELTMVRPADLKMRLRLRGDFISHCVRAREFEKGTGRITLDLEVPDFRPWTPEDPFLCTLQIQAGEDLVESYFAMRKLSVGMDENRRPRLFLNNEPYFFNGVLDQGYWPESLYTPPSDDAMKADIRNMKELGFNTIRKHMKIEPLRWYYHCDRIGMIVWQDMVNGGGTNHLLFTCYLPNALPPVTERIRDDRHYILYGRASADDRLQWERECKRTIEALYNCPCIALWTIFNEGWGQFDSLRLEKEIRAMDPTRLIDHASGWYDQGGGDVKSVHNYFRALKIKNDRRPFVLSEYGGYSCTIPGHVCSDVPYGYRTYGTTEELSAALKKLRQTIEKLQEKGLSGAIFTQLSDIEEETNGLYTWDREICKVK